MNGTTPLVDLPEPRDGSIVTFSYPIKPVITKIADYKGIETKVEEKKVDEKAVNDELSRLALNEAELLPTTENAKLGDIATLEVKGSINGIDKPELNENLSIWKSEPTSLFPALKRMLRITKLVRQ